jgi:hypothetical protein
MTPGCCVGGMKKKQSLEMGRIGRNGRHHTKGDLGRVEVICAAVTAGTRPIYKSFIRILR